MPGHYERRYPGTSDRRLVWVNDRRHKTVADVTNTVQFENKKVSDVAVAAGLPARMPFKPDEIVLGLIERVRARIRCGQHATAAEMKALVQASSASLLQHGNGKVRADATRTLAKLVLMEERLAAEDRRERARSKRHAERMAPRPAPGNGLPGLVVPGASVAARPLLPRPR